jgi:CspA family cold shock protein
MFRGTVKWFNTVKGYGFISPEVGEKDVFVHITQVQKCGLKRLFPGQNISFEKYDDRGRVAAGNLQLL